MRRKRDVAMLRLYVSILSPLPLFHRDYFLCSRSRISATASASDSAAPEAFGLAPFALPVLVVAGGRRQPDLSPATLELHSLRLPMAALAAVLSQSACAGTSGHAALPCKQKTQQSPPSASDLPVASGHR